MADDDAAPDEVEQGLSVAAKVIGIGKFLLPFLGPPGWILTALGALGTIVGAAESAEPAVKQLGATALNLLHSHATSGIEPAQSHADLLTNSAAEIEDHWRSIRLGTAPHPR